MAIDLHMHSTVSDGEWTPERLVEDAKALGLSAIAVSDHDSLEGSRRAMAKGKELGVEVIPAVEISASLDGVVLHVLAYFVDLENAALHQTLEDICRYRQERAEMIIGKVNAELVAENKTPIDLALFVKMGKEKPITRADIAEHLKALGHVATRNEAFERWLNDYNVPNRELSVPDTIRIVHEAGGLAILAHPYSEYLSLNGISKEFEKHKSIILDLKAQGLDGIEVFRFNRGTEDVQKKYADFAKANGLLVTGGSDFHGPNFLDSAPRIGETDATDDLLAEMRSRVATR